MAEETPLYQKKQFFEINQDILNAAKNYAKGGYEGYKAYNYLRDKGFDVQSPQQINALLKNPDYVTSKGIGKVFSYEDLAREALQGDPNFDPEDVGALTSFAQELEKRGLKNTDREKISTLATQQSVKGQIDKAVNPGKYIDETQRAANLETANRLIAQNLGADASDPDLADFIAEQIAGGESAFEVSQFLQTTPQFMEKKAAKDREMINQELLKGEEEVFKKAIPQIMGSYQKAGRLSSSGLDSAIANARTELASQRQGMLTGYAREDVVGARNAAFQNYLRQSEPGYQQRFNVQNASNFSNFQQPYNNLFRQYQLNDEARQRQYQIEDYDRQQSDFNRYLSDSKKQSREAALYGLLGAGVSGGIQGLLR